MRLAAAVQIGLNAENIPDMTRHLSGLGIKAVRIMARWQTPGKGENTVARAAVRDLQAAGFPLESDNDYRSVLRVP